MPPATTFVANFESIATSVIIYTGLFLFTLGMSGNILNIIVFMSLKTFRRNPCVFCLFILSISESGVLLLFTLPDTFFDIFQAYGDVLKLYPCNMRISFLQAFVLMSQLIMSIAAIDQRLSTSMPDRHHGTNLKIIRYLIIISTTISILHSIPFLIFYDAQLLPGTNASICRIDDNGPFSIYALYIALPIIDGLLPTAIMSVCGLVALRNVRNMRKKNVHIVRFRLEQQLTAMVLTKILSVYLTVIPLLIVYIVRYIISLQSLDTIFQRQFLIAFRLLTLLIYTNYAVSYNN